jgi:hypothetical protein
MAELGMDPVDERARALLEQLRSRPSSTVVEQAVNLLKPLRNGRHFVRLGEMAEALSRIQPKNAALRVPYGQSLIETGRARAAIDVLKSALQLPGVDKTTRDELWGLIGRANKQIYIDAVERGSEASHEAINESVRAYRVPHDEGRRTLWHEINLAAVLYAARRGGADPEQGRGLDGNAIAQGVVDQLDRIPSEERDSWWTVTRAEARVALGQWRHAEQDLRSFVTDPEIPAFNIAAVLRQLREVWEIHREGPEGAGLLQLLEARLAQLHDSTLELRPEYVRAVRKQNEPTDAQRQRVLGNVGAEPIRWYRQALDCAASVAAVRVRYGARFGTAFAVSATDLGLESSEPLVLTNFHVINRGGADKAEKPEQSEIIFEAAATSGLGPYKVAEVLAESPLSGGLDYALLRLEPGAKLPAPLSIARDLPRLDDSARVSVIGHPNREELHLALQDNKLLDHEGPPDGQPRVPERVRVHYFTPTSPGNSGSPVFDSTWQVIALHHTGGRYNPLASELGLPQLNGKPDRYSANEGIWMESIRQDIARQMKKS